MIPDSEKAILRAVAALKGRVDGMAGEFPCDLSGTKPGCPTGTDVIDYVQDDLSFFRGETVVIPEEFRQEVLKAYADSYNKVAGRERYG